MRNVDLIKELREKNAALSLANADLEKANGILTHEIGRYMKKVSDQVEIIKRQSDENEAYKQINNIQSAYLVYLLGLQVSLSNEEGGRDVRIPKEAIRRTIAKYTTTAKEDGEYYVITVLEAKHENGEDSH